MKKALVAMLTVLFTLSVALFAVACGGKTYTVTFDANGGSAVESVSVADGKTVSKPADPTKEDFRFDGWTLDGTAYDFATPVKGDITLTAKWTQVKAAYAVEIWLEQDDGSFAKQSNNATAKGDIGTLDVTSIAGTFAPTGYVFDADNAQNVASGNLTAAGDLVLKLYFEKLRADYSVRLVFETLTGEEDRTADFTAEIGALGALRDIVGKTVSAEALASLNVTGYNYDAVNSTASATLAEEGTVLTLKYTLKEYEVTFMAEGQEYDTATVKHGAKVSAPATNPEKRNYNFSGWKVGTDNFDFANTSITEAVTIVASFTQFAADYTVKVFFENLDGTYTDKTADYQEEILASVGGIMTKEIGETVDFSDKLAMFETAGFVLNGANSVLSGTVQASGLEIIVKYNRTTHTITYNVGNEEVQKFENVKYGAATPAYTGAEITKATDAYNVYFFKGFGGVTETVTQDQNYVAEFYEVENVSTYEYNRFSVASTALPIAAVTQEFSGYTVKHYLGGNLVTEETKMSNIGNNNWKVEVLDGDDVVLTCTQVVKVIDPAQYWKNILPTTGGQHHVVDKIYYHGYNSVGFAHVDEAKYGVPYAYLLTIVEEGRDKDAYTKRVIMKNNLSFNAFDQLVFDFNPMGSNISLNCAYYGSKHLGIKVIDLETLKVVTNKEMQADKWYRAVIDLTATASMAVNQEFFIAFADQGECGTALLKDMRLVELDADTDASQFAIVEGCKVNIINGQTYAGRNNVTLFSTTEASEWTGRFQMTPSALASWQEVHAAANGGVMKIDFAFTGRYSEEIPLFLYFRPISGTASTNYLHTGVAGVSYQNADGEAVAYADLQVGTWYTMIIDVKTIGAMSANGGDCGLQLGVNNKCAGLFFDNIRYEINPVPFALEVLAENLTGDYDDVTATYAEIIADTFGDMTANVGASVDATALSIAITMTGFAFDADASVLTATVAADGSTKLTVKFNRNQITVTFMNGDETYEEKTVKYGAVVSAPANAPESDSADMVFDAWLLENDEAYDFATPVTSPVVLHASFKLALISYNVKVEEENVDGEYEDVTAEYLDAITTAMGGKLKGSAGEIVDITSAANTVKKVGFAINSASVLTGTIAVGEELTLTIRYNRTTHTVTYKVGSEEVQKTENVRYGAATPAYAGEAITKETDAYNLYFFKGFGEVAETVTEDAVYAAEFIAVENVATYIYKEGSAATLLPLDKVATAFDGYVVNQYWNDALINEETVMAQGENEWKVDVLNGETIVYSFTQKVVVVSANTYLENVLPMGGGQHHVDDKIYYHGYNSVGFAHVDEAKYGVPYAYLLTIVEEGRNADAYTKRVIMQSAYTSAIDFASYSQLVFDFNPMGSNISLNCAYYGSKHLGITVIDLETLKVVSNKEMQADKWYRAVIDLTAAASQGANKELFICYADQGECGTALLNDMRLVKLDADTDASQFAIVEGCKVNIVNGQTYAGRNNVTLFSATDASEWNGRFQMTPSALASWQEVHAAANGGVMMIDFAFAGRYDENIPLYLYFRPISGNGGTNFLHTGVAGVSYQNADGEAVAYADLQVGTWYTMVIDVKTIGAMSANGGDCGLQFGVNNKCAGLFFDNIRYEVNPVSFGVEVLAENLTGDYDDVTATYAEIIAETFGEMTAKVGASVDGTALSTAITMTGFAFDADASVLTATVAADGSTKLTVKFNRNQITVTFMNGEEIFEEKTVKYGATVSAPDTEPTSDDENYQFAGWETENGEAYVFTTPVTQAITLKASFKQSLFAYNVKVEEENVDGEYEDVTAEYVDAITSALGGNLKGEAGESVDVTALATDLLSEGFEVNSGSTLTGTITEEGLTLTIRYNRKLFTVTYKNGEEEVQKFENVRYGAATPAYSNAMPTVSATNTTVFVFVGFGEVSVTVDGNAEYAAEYVDVKNYANYYYKEGANANVLPLSAVAEVLGEYTLKNFINDVEVTAETTLEVGNANWKVEVYAGETKVSESTQTVVVLSSADYAKEFAKGNSDQHLDRFGYDKNYTSLSYNAEKGAYQFTFLAANSGSGARWNERLEMTSSNVNLGAEYDLTAYKTVSFEMMWESTPFTAQNLKYTLTGNFYNDNFELAYAIVDANGNPVKDSDLKANTWYTYYSYLQLKAEPTSVGYRIYWADSDSNGAVFMRNFRLIKEDILYMSNDANKVFRALNCSVEAVTGEVFGRTNVLQYNGTAGQGGYGQRMGMTTRGSALYAMNQAVAMDAYWCFDICAPADGSIQLQWWKGGGTPAPTGADSHFKYYTCGENPQEVAYADLQAGVWYTVKVQISYFGTFTVPATDGTCGPSIAHQAVATLYFDNLRFELPNA